MRRAVLTALGFLVLLAARLAAAGEISAIAYHDIVPVKNGDRYAITVKDFERQMAYLKQAGYQPISLDTLEKTRAGQAALPAKPVLLTFDDGYKSYYQHAFPLLQKYGFPSVVSIVTAWIDGRSAPDYMSADLMSWTDLREIAHSPLVEVLSHTDDMHRSGPSNPFDGRMPVAITRLYDATAGAYETDADHRARVRADLARSAMRIEKELGARPIGVTWPYGKYEQALVDAAAELGMRYHLTLDSTPTRTETLPGVNRETFRDYRALNDFGEALTFHHYRKQQLRFVEVDIAPIVARPADEQAQLVAQLARRMEVLRADAVVLRPFSPDGRRAYFDNAAAPVAADILSRIAHQLTNNAGLQELYLSIPEGVNRHALADLARLNWFTGLALEGAADAKELAGVAEIVRRYKPALKLGLRTDAPVAGMKADFVLIDLAADTPPVTIARLAANALERSAARPLFLLQRGPGTTDSVLRRAMASLRAAGAAHYGYGPDDYADDLPAPLRIVRALTEHTIVRGDP